MPPALDAYIAQRFAARYVRFYHAENLRNFRSYCASHALLSRAELMRRDPAYYTRFNSDANDQQLGALDRIFGNLYDFGTIFCRARNAIPNIYGPITLVFRPAVFAAMTDIIITPRSIATHLANWTSVALSTPAEIDQLVMGDAYGNPIASQWQFCELSSGNSLMPFQYLERILVEPMNVCGSRLVDIVRQEVADSNISIPVDERYFPNGPNRIALSELVARCEELPHGIPDDQWQLDEATLPPYFSALDVWRRGRVIGWCRYFYFGTVEELRRVDAAESLDEYDDRTICTLCDPGSERPPALVNYESAREGLPGSSAIDIGWCDWCSSLSIRCRICGTVQGVYESEYGTTQGCDGLCGMHFIARDEYDPRDGGGSVVVEVVSDGSGDYDADYDEDGTG